MAEQPAQKCGRPATRTEGWEMTHKRIRLLNVTFERWRAAVLQGQFPCHWQVDLQQQLTASLFIQEIHQSTSKRIKLVSYTPLSDQLYRQYGLLHLPFLFT